MTTLTDLIDRIATDHLVSARRPYRNRLNGAITDSATSLTLTRDFGAALKAGGRLSIGLEDLEVWSADSTLKTCDVERGSYGTTAASHLNNDTVLVNPKYSPAQILRALNDELLALPGDGLFRYQEVTLTSNSSKLGYEIPSTANVIDVYEVRIESLQATNDWFTVHDWEIVRNADTTDFPSGVAIMFPGFITNGRPIRITYRSAFDQLATLNDNVETVSGIDTRMLDIVSMGAAIRLLGGTAVHAANPWTQGTARRADEVPVGSVRQSATLLREIRLNRINDERGIQMRSYPPRGRHR